MFAQNELVSAMHDVQSGGGDPDPHAQRELEARAAGIKAVATAHASATIAVCREACGGAGYLAVNRLPALKADTDVFTTFEGDNTVLLQLVAKGLLTDYRDTFGNLDTLGMVRFAARQLAGSVIERTAARGLVERLVAAAPGRDAQDGRARPRLAVRAVRRAGAAPVDTLPSGCAGRQSRTPTHSRSSTTPRTT